MIGCSLGPDRGYLVRGGGSFQPSVRVRPRSHGRVCNRVEFGATQREKRRQTERTSGFRPAHNQSRFRKMQVEEALEEQALGLGQT